MHAQLISLLSIRRSLPLQEFADVLKSSQELRNQAGLQKSYFEGAQEVCGSLNACTDCYHCGVISFPPTTHLYRRGAFPQKDGSGGSAGSFNDYWRITTC
eukprot:1157141-Pelagomonas_calceolata.AAC.3